MLRPPLPTLFLALVLLAAPAAADLATDILPGNDPDAAYALLHAPELQTDLKARDPAGFPKLFARAAELQDLHDLFFGPDDAAQLRLALAARPDCAFCQKPAPTLAWVTARLASLPAERRAVLARVYWEWTQLGPRRAWLTAHGTDEASWGTLDLDERRDRLVPWAQEESAAIAAMRPKNGIEADVMQNRIYAVYEVLGSAGSAPLLERLVQVRTGLSALDAVKGQAAASKNAAVRKAYSDAMNATDPAARLQALSRVFDGLGRRDPAVLAQAPARPGQAFDDRTRDMVAALLGSGLMRETDGTWAGQELRDFYAAHPLKVKVAPAPNAAFLAWYANDVMTFNEKFISQYVKSQGRTLDDLAKDPELLQPLLREIVPVFVHEATHHRQDLWAKAQNIPFYTGEGAEKEAMMTESLFVMQKARLDPSYARFLAANQDRSTNVKEAVILAARLQKDRASWFGETVMATHYPEWLSISGQVWCQILWHNRIGDPIQAELTRRARLPEAERAPLADGKPLDANYASLEDFEKALPGVATKALEDVVAQQKRALERSPETYAAYVKRLEDVTALTDRRLDELAAAAAAPKKDRVPAPDMARRRK